MDFSYILSVVAFICPYKHVKSVCVFKINKVAIRLARHILLWPNQSCTVFSSAWNSLLNDIVNKRRFRCERSTVWRTYVCTSLLWTFNKVWHQRDFGNWCNVTFKLHKAFGLIENYWNSRSNHYNYHLHVQRRISILGYIRNCNHHVYFCRCISFLRDWWTRLFPKWFSLLARGFSRRLALRILRYL